MQIKIITVPIIGGDAANDELNKFLRGYKILKVEQEITTSGSNAYWSFCIHYIEPTVGGTTQNQRLKVDYRASLSEAEFQRFSKFRSIRKQLAEKEAVPAYAIFTDEELAKMSQFEVLTIADMKKTDGIGIKKIEKYALFFIPLEHEKER